MAGETLRINTLLKRYHLREEEQYLKTPLDALLEDTLTQRLPAALALAGISPKDEICIRCLRLPLSYKLQLSEHATAHQWSELMAQAIKNEVLNGGDNVLRYANRQRALLDFAAGVAKADLRHAWAWQQLQLASFSGEADLYQAQQQLILCLLRHPQSVPATLRHLAKGRMLIALLRQLPPEASKQLAALSLAVSAAGLSGSDDTATQPAFSEAAVASLYKQLEQATSITALLKPGAIPLQQSAIAEELFASAAHSSLAIQALPIGAMEWAALIATEVDNAVFLRGPELCQQRLHSLYRQLLSQLPQGLFAAENENCHKNALKEDKSALYSDNLEKNKKDANVEITNTYKTELKPNHSGPQQAEQGLQPQTNSSQPSSIHSGELAFAKSHYSPVAGLVFLLHPLKKDLFQGGAPLVERLLSNALFKRRSTPWVLYHFYTQLINLPAKDPMLRLLCGFDLDLNLNVEIQDDEFKTCQHQAPKGEEQRQLRGYADELLAILKLYLPQQSEEQCLAFVCQRAAQISQDGAWVECGFDMQQVDTQVRRAGLDLDPGYIPWLGKVVVIRYE